MEPDEGYSCNNLKRSMFEGPDDDGSENEEMSSEEDEEMSSEEGECVFNREFDEDRRFDMYVDPTTPSELKSYDFVNPEGAYDSYKDYALVNGFNVRKNKAGRVKGGDHKVWHSFVCSREGGYDMRNWDEIDRQRELLQGTRRGCEAEMRICLDPDSGRWNVAYLNDEHNHPLIEITQTMELNLVDSDAISAIKHLHDLASTDPFMRWRYKVDSDGLLSRLFWSDSTSQFDYRIFGDVLAIDTTYKMNKYNYQLVVFSGSNNHNQTCVFGSGIVSDESEENYSWLLLQFLFTMKSKRPQTVITNGDCSMMNAVKCYFPASQVRHRLCSSHLLRNATVKVGQPRFTELFAKCMLGDYEINAFEQRWKAMVEECGVNHIKWVRDMYEKKYLWATAYTRGKFFLGCRGSSGCEGLLKQVDKSFQSRSSLAELVKNFNHCLECHTRFKEVDDESKFGREERVLKTELKQLERSGSLVYTRDIFGMYRTMLLRSYLVKVLEHKETTLSTTFIIGEYRKPLLKWIVSFHPKVMEFRCSCYRMESFGIPCAHILKVMMFLDMTELPKSLILNRWTKNAKDTFVYGLEARMGVENDNCYHKRKMVAGETSRLGKKDRAQLGTSAKCVKSLGGKARLGTLP